MCTCFQEQERADFLKQELENLQTDVLNRKKTLSDQKAEMAEKTALLVSTQILVTENTERPKGLNH